MSGFERVAEAVEANGRKLDAVLRGLTLMTESQSSFGQLLEAIHKACTADIPESPYAGPVRVIAQAMQEQTGILRDLTDTIEGQPEAIRAAVLEALDAKGAGE